MIPQVAPDWSMIGTKEKLEKELQGFKFEGPGFYLSKTDTLLVVLDEGMSPSQSGSVWSKHGRPVYTHYRVYVYNCVLADTIFVHIGSIPTRKDDR